MALVWSWLGAGAASAATPLLRQLLPGLVIGLPGGALLWYGLRKSAREAARARDSDGGEAPLRLGFAIVAGALVSAAGALAVVDVLAEFVRGLLFP
jgi:hypothetical protein